MMFPNFVQPIRPTISLPNIIRNPDGTQEIIGKHSRIITGNGQLLIDHTSDGITGSKLSITKGSNGRDTVHTSNFRDPLNGVETTINDVVTISHWINGIDPSLTAGAR